MRRRTSPCAICRRRNRRGPRVSISPGIATAILPGIFVLVPSGLASSGSLIAGIQYADQVRYNLETAGNSTSTSNLSDTSVASLGFGMIQVAIGITVGLFLAALVVYPFGKKRTGLFSF